MAPDSSLLDRAYLADRSRHYASALASAGALHTLPEGRWSTPLPPPTAARPPRSPGLDPSLLPGATLSLSDASPSPPAPAADGESLLVAGGEEPAAATAPPAGREVLVPIAS